MICVKVGYRGKSSLGGSKYSIRTACEGSKAGGVKSQFGELAIHAVGEMYDHILGAIHQKLVFRKSDKLGLAVIGASIIDRYH